MKLLFRSSLAELTNHLVELESCLLRLEQTVTDPLLLQAHQQVMGLLGYAQFFAQEALEQIACRLQELLKELRESKQALGPDLVDQLLSLLKQTKSLLDEVLAQWPEGEALPGQAGADFFAEQLQPLLEQLEWPAPVAPVPSPPTPPVEVVSVVLSFAGQTNWLPGLKEDFLAESEERLGRMESALLDIEQQPTRTATHLDGMFRELHSLKGNAATLIAMLPNDPLLRERHALLPFKELVHETESLVSNHREDRQPFSSAEVEVLLRVLDTCRKLLESIAADESARESITALLEGLQPAQPVAPAPTPPPARWSPPPPPETLPPEVRAFLNTAGQCLRTLGRMAELPAAEFGEEGQRKKFRRTAKTFEKAASKFNHPLLKEAAEHLLDVAETEQPLQEATLQYLLQTEAILERLRSGELESFSREAGPAEQLPVVETPAPEEPGIPPSAGPAGEPPERAEREVGKKDAGAPQVYVRVPQSRVDRMMNLVGELLVSKHSFRSLSEELGRDQELSVMSGRVQQAGSVVGRIADDLRVEMMEIRMVPLELIFSRFPRLVRDLSKSSGKPIRLVVQGGEVRLDKSLAEQLNDPLVHMLRNSADHGIEAPEVRRAAGKPVEGTLTLRAQRQGQRVILTLQDDGQGLPLERLRQKALERGLLSEAEAERLSTKELQELIFRPGLSTAEKVTDISGRGVGMDAVRQFLSEINAGVSVESEPGQGTQIALSIPLTLAVSQGLLVRSSGSHYILPLESVEEIVKVPRQQIRHFGPAQRFLEHRGAVLPVTDLQNLTHRAPQHRSEESCRLLVINSVQMRYALEVDQVLHEMEILVKPMEGGLHQIQALAGTTISGDGSVILVLNPAELFQETLG